MRFAVSSAIILAVWTHVGEGEGQGVGAGGRDYATERAVLLLGRLMGSSVAVHA